MLPSSALTSSIGAVSATDCTAKCTAKCTAESAVVRKMGRGGGRERVMQWASHRLSWCCYCGLHSRGLIEKVACVCVCKQASKQDSFGAVAGRCVGSSALSLQYRQCTPVHYCTVVLLCGIGEGGSVRGWQLAVLQTRSAGGGVLPGC